MENLPTYSLTQSGPETQEILDQVNLNTIDIEQLKRLYQALNQSDPEIIEPNDTWPVANPEENVIYRVIDRVNTPPESYSDYMWNGTAMVLMATYDNAIDPTPTPGSNNPVASGGVLNYVSTNGSAYDISAANSGTAYADLAAALGTDGANVPEAVRKGGMSIKFVQSSDNKYVQYRLMSNTFNTTVANWQGVDDTPTAGSDNLVKSGGVSESLQQASKKLYFQRGTYSQGKYVYSDIRVISALVKVELGDFLCINNNNTYNVEIDVFDAEGQLTLFGWLPPVDRYRIWKGGNLQIILKRTDNQKFTDDEIEYLNSLAADARIMSGEIEKGKSIGDWIERGSVDNNWIESYLNLSIRANNGLFSAEVHRGDIIRTAELYEAGIRIELAILDKNDLSVIEHKTALVNNYIVRNDGYARLLFKKNPLTDDDLEVIKTNLKIVKPLCLKDREFLGIHNGRLNNGYEEESPVRLISDLFQINDGDSIDTNIIVPEVADDNIHFTYIGYFNEDFTKYKEITFNTYRRYIHSHGSGYAYVVWGCNSQRTVSINELKGKAIYTRVGSAYSQYGIPFILSDKIVIGSIGGDGTDNNNATRVKTELPIPIIGRTKIELLDTENYLMSVSNYTFRGIFYNDVAWTTSDITLVESENTAYTRILLRKADSSAFDEDEISDLNQLIRVTRSSEAETSEKGILPSYYKDEVESVITRITDAFTPSAFSYAILTDIHDDTGASTGYMSSYFKRELNALVELSRKTNLLFIGILGDITTGTRNKTKTDVLYKQVLDIIEDAKCPVLFVRGNHDDLTDYEPKAEKTKSVIRTGREFLVKMASAANPELHTVDDYENNCTYYIDFPAQNIRVIAMDNQVSYPLEINQSGYLVYTGGQGNWRGINENQIKWLINDALVLPDNDWRVILLGHDFTHTKLASYGSAYEGGLRNYDIFDAVKAAFNAKVSSLILSGSKKSDERNEFLPELNNDSTPITYPSWVTSADFSNAKGKIIVESSGHQHSDTFWKDGNNIIQHNVGSAAPHMQWNHWETPYGVNIGVTSWEDMRENNTITEALADVILVGKSKVNRIRFGAKAVSDTKINEYNI